MSLVRLLGFTTLSCGCVVGRYRELATNREVSYVEEKGQTCDAHGHQSGANAFDALRIGTTFADVAPATSDFDGNGKVNGEDLSNWKTGVGPAPVTGSQGDSDGDLDADGADFLVWQRQVGFQASPSPELAVVPEPDAFFLVVAGSLGVVVGRRW